MRKSGASTKKECWNLKIVNNNNVLFDKNYPSLKLIGEDIGYKYNRVVELSIGRKKQQSGVYDSQYIFTKINNKVCEEEHKPPSAEEVAED